VRVVAGVERDASTYTRPAHTDSGWWMSDRVAGPRVRTPLLSKVEPWQGQLVDAPDSTMTTHPLCGHTADIA
jgi:hypothetical protein